MTTVIFIQGAVAMGFAGVMAAARLGEGARASLEPLAGTRVIRGPLPTGKDRANRLRGR